MILFPSHRRDPSSALVQKALIAPCGTGHHPPPPPPTPPIRGPQRRSWESTHNGRMAPDLKQAWPFVPPAAPDAFFCPVFITFSKPSSTERKQQEVKDPPRLGRGSRVRPGNLNPGGWWSAAPVEVSAVNSENRLRGIYCVEQCGQRSEVAPSHEDGACWGY